MYQTGSAVYEADCLEEEPAYQYVPDTDTPHHHGTDALAQSMLLLADGLASGLLLAQFDKLYRKKPGLSTADAKRPDNQLKNRYRDISPCEFLPDLTLQHNMPPGISIQVLSPLSVIFI